MPYTNNDRCIVQSKHTHYWAWCNRNKHIIEPDVIIVECAEETHLFLDSATSFIIPDVYHTRLQHTKPTSNTVPDVYHTSYLAPDVYHTRLLCTNYLHVWSWGTGKLLNEVLLVLIVQIIVYKNKRTHRLQIWAAWLHECWTL